MLTSCGAASRRGISRISSIVLRRLDEGDVGARFDEGGGAVDRGLEAERGACIGARHDEEVPVVAGVDGGLDLAEHLVERNHVLAGEVAAAFRADLVLDLHRARAGALERADRVAHVQRIAEAGIGVDHDRQLHRIADRRRVLGDLRQARRSRGRAGRRRCS